MRAVKRESGADGRVHPFLPSIADSLLLPYPTAATCSRCLEAAHDLLQKCTQGADSLVAEPFEVMPVTPRQIHTSGRRLIRPLNFGRGSMPSRRTDLYTPLTTSHASVHYALRHANNVPHLAMTMCPCDRSFQMEIVGLAQMASTCKLSHASTFRIRRRSECL